MIYIKIFPVRVCVGGGGGGGGGGRKCAFVYIYLNETPHKNKELMKTHEPQGGEGGGGMKLWVCMRFIIIKFKRG